MIDYSQYMTEKEAAKYLGYHWVTLGEWRKFKKGWGPVYYQFAGRYWYLLNPAESQIPRLGLRE